MTQIIVDSSVATAWCSKSQATDVSEAAFNSATHFGIVVPVHFQLEVANSLWQLERRTRIATPQVDEFLGWLSQLPITIDTLAQSATYQLILPIARRYNLTTYDAAYLELALRTQLPLATRDEALLAACKKAGAPLLSGRT